MPETKTAIADEDFDALLSGMEERLGFSESYEGNDKVDLNAKFDIEVDEERSSPNPTPPRTSDQIRQDKRDVLAANRKALYEKGYRLQGLDELEAKAASEDMSGLDKLLADQMHLVAPIPFSGRNDAITDADYPKYLDTMKASGITNPTILSMEGYRAYIKAGGTL